MEPFVNDDAVHSGNQPANHLNDIADKNAGPPDINLDVAYLLAGTTDSDNMLNQGTSDMDLNIAPYQPR